MHHHKVMELRLLHIMLAAYLCVHSYQLLYVLRLFSWTNTGIEFQFVPLAVALATTARSGTNHLAASVPLTGNLQVMLNNSSICSINGKSTSNVK